MLSNYLSIFANSGANILTINQTIPTNGCAGVTISAETSDMNEGLDEMIAGITGAMGVLKSWPDKRKAPRGKTSRCLYLFP